MNDRRKSGSPPSGALTPAAQQALQLAVNALATQAADKAEHHLRHALSLAPRQPGILRLLGVAMGMQGRHDEAIVVLKSAMQRASTDAAMHLSLGNALNAAGKRADAVRAFRRAAELAPEVAAIRFNLGKTLFDDHCSEEALPVLREAVRLAPDMLRARFLLADVLRVGGELDAAAAEYRSVLVEHPHSGEAWLGLAGLKHLRFDASDVEHMQAAYHDETLNEDDCISIRFSLARGLEDLGRYEEAFAMFVEANARARRWYPWDASHFAQRVEAFVDALPPAARAEPPQLGREVIFIVGMPRSGTSLIEQILASHSQVCGAGELTDLPAVLHDESVRRGQEFPAWAHSASAADWERLGRDYLARTVRWRGTERMSTDKLPDNWRFVGVIRAMLPGARIIHCARNPVETSLSCFRQLFSGGGQPFSYDLEDTAAYWHAVERAHRHWTDTCTSHYRCQDYEKLVADTEQEIRALLEFCGLPFEHDCLEFHTTHRNVRTASASQVREPVRSDTARAGDYGTLLDPLRRLLAAED